MFNDQAEEFDQAVDNEMLAPDQMRSVGVDFGADSQDAYRSAGMTHGQPIDDLGWDQPKAAAVTSRNEFFDESPLADQYVYSVQGKPLAGDNLAGDDTPGASSAFGQMKLCSEMHPAAEVKQRAPAEYLSSRLADTAPWGECEMAEDDDGSGPLDDKYFADRKNAQDAIVSTMKVEYPQYNHSVDLAATRGLNQLHVAAILNRPDHVLAVARSQPDLIESRSPNDGLTPLHRAAFRGSLLAVQALLSVGAQVDSRSAQGQYTPLLLAAFSGDIPVINCLIQAGADIAAVADGGWNVMHQAARRNDHRVIYNFLDHYRGTRALCEARTEKNGWCAYDIALLNGNHGVAQVIRERISAVNSMKTQMQVEQMQTTAAGTGNGAMANCQSTVC